MLKEFSQTESYYLTISTDILVLHCRVVIYILTLTGLYINDLISM